MVRRGDRQRVPGLTTSNNREEPRDMRRLSESRAQAARHTRSARRRDARTQPSVEAKLKNWGHCKGQIDIFEALAEKAE